MTAVTNFLAAHNAEKIHTRIGVPVLIALLFTNFGGGLIVLRFAGTAIPIPDAGLEGTL